MRKEREEAPKAGEVSLPTDSVNEAVVVAAAAVSPEARGALVSRIPADHFVEPKHSAIWSALRELDRRHLAFDLATLPALAADVDVSYLAKLMELRPDPPPNLEHHVQTLFWDRTRIIAWTGPLSGLVTAMRDPRAERDRVRALAQQVAQSFDGFGDRQHLLDRARLVRDQINEIKQRRAGFAIYPYGIRSLDELKDQHTGYPLIVPGAMPGQTTLVTGVSGSGKSTLLGHLILGQARQKKKVLVGAWEMSGGLTLELVACLSLKWSRTAVMLGNLTDDHLKQLEFVMSEISKYVLFMANPFNEGAARTSNDKNLDSIYGYIADSGADVAFFDLWERCLEDDDPSEEKRAIYRMHKIGEKTRCHIVMAHQQRLGDVEKRPDKRPTREGVKGSKAYIEVADTVIGTHRPALFKAVPDNVFEMIILKQRYGRWPIAIEYDWEADTGQISNGREVPYESADSSGGGMMESFIGTPGSGKKRR